MAERLDGERESAIERAARALRAGELVVYPTETVYGLGADALDPAAVERVFEAKHRDRDAPVSLAVPSVAAAGSVVAPTERERAFMDAFLPGPVTVVLQRGERVPDALTGGLERVGLRVPDHPIARRLLETFAPITATSANVSGRSSVRELANIDPEIEAAVSVVLEGGVTGGGGSTVVDVRRGELIRAGPLVEAITDWMERH